MANLINQFFQLDERDRVREIASQLRRILHDHAQPDVTPLDEETVALANETILLCTRFLEPAWVVVNSSGVPVAFARGHLTVTRCEKIRRKAVWRGALGRKEPFQFKELT